MLRKSELTVAQGQDGNPEIVSDSCCAESLDGLGVIQQDTYSKEQERCINEDCAQRKAVGYTQHRLALAAYWFKLVFAGQDGYCIG